MPSERRRTSSRRSTSSKSSGFGASSSAKQEAQPWLVTLCDIGLLAGLWVVTGWFGGRTPLGQFLLVGLAGFAAVAWSLHQVTSAERGWVRTHGVFLGALICAIPILQLWSLPSNVRQALSPMMASIFPSWSTPYMAQILQQEWDVLSLAPGATLLATPVAVAYVLLFLTAVQRMREVQDVERMLRWIAGSAAFWGVVGLLQYAFPNGKLLWVIEPAWNLSPSCATGPFTTRNHYAQFLALGLGPMVWCVYAAATSEPPRAERSPTSFGGHHAESSSTNWPLIVWSLCLGTTAIAAVLSLSRGGFLAMGCALAVPLAVLLLRGGSKHAWLVGVVGLGIFATGSMGLDTVSERFADRGDNGRFPIWSANWKVACEFPWTGTGIGTHINAHHRHLETPPHANEYTHAESSWLQIASETGFGGMVLALVCVLWIAGPLVRLVVVTQDASRALAAAAILGSLTGNLVQSVADFIWYIPALVISLILLCACGRRLAELSSDTPVPVRATPAFLWMGTAGGVACATLVGLAILTPAVEAEPLAREYLRMSWQANLLMAGMSDEEKEYFLQERARSVIAAAKASPDDSRLQSAAARACIQIFETEMQKSDCPMSLLELKDAARGAGFETPAETLQWIRKITGPRWKMLDAARRFALRALRASPLESSACLVLAELAFLEDATGDIESQLIAQALVLRPQEASIRYAAGETAMLKGEQETAVAHWQIAFLRGPDFRPRIAKVLAHLYPADELIALLQPDWKSIGILTSAYEACGNAEQRDAVRRYHVQVALEKARHPEAEARDAGPWSVAFQQLVALQEKDAALAVLQEGLERMPQNPSLRRSLGVALVEARRYQEAVPHLRWFADRNPQDQHVATLLDQIGRQRPKASGVSAASHTEVR